MKVLLAHNYYREEGGEDLTFSEDVELLESHGHSVTKFVTDNSSIKGNLPIRIAPSTIWSQKSYRSVIDILRGGGFSIAHFHNTFPLISPSAYYAARAANVPVVQCLSNYRLICPGATLTRDGSDCHLCTTKRLPWPAVRYACYRQSRLVTGCLSTMLAMHHVLRTWTDLVDAYVITSEFVRTQFVDAGFPESKLFVKPNFVTPDPGCRTTSGSYFVFVGRLSPEKGLTTLLEAWQKLGSVAELLIVGDGPMRGDVLRASDANPNVRWLGRRTHEDVLSIMKGALCVVFPSVWHETFGRVIAEAYACGVPVIAAYKGARSCTVWDGQTGLCVRTGDAEDLAAKIDWVRTHPDQVAKMGRQAREEFETKYTAEINYARVMEIYSRVMR